MEPFHPTDSFFFPLFFKVIALEAIVRGGTKVSEKKFLVLTELLMVQLLQLDTIEANGEAKVQRKVEVSDSPVVLTITDFCISFL